MNDNLEESVRQVMADVLGLEPAQINDDTSTTNTPTWDSANHIQLVVALEQEFNVSFDVDEFESMLTFPDVVQALQAKLS